VLVPFACSEACRLTVQVRVDRATARRLRSGLVIGRGAKPIRAAASGNARVTLGRAARMHLARGRTLRAVIRVTAVDAAGNRTVVSRRIVLGR
jgi:hypothetical protein